MSAWPSKIKETLIWAGLLAPLALYGLLIGRRPAPEPTAQIPLFEGISYRRLIEQSPRPQVLHLLEIDLSNPGVVPFGTPGIPGALIGS